MQNAGDRAQVRSRTKIWATMALPMLAWCGLGGCGVGNERSNEASPSAGPVGSVELQNRSLRDGLELGVACTTGAQCASGFCVDGVCCVSACGGGVITDCLSCSMAAGGTLPDGTCGPRTGGAGCNDGDLCTSNDTCSLVGMCQPGAAVVCMEEPCRTAGTCNPATGVCDNPAKVNGTVCEDNSLCTTGTTCTDGVCGTVTVICVASDQCHDVGVCDSGTGVCTDPVKMNGTACNDANACTQTDACQAGACLGANPVVCAASDQCHEAGTCSSATGVCSNPPKADLSPCNDNNMCTTMDRCMTGACVMGGTLDCNDNDPCTTDSCAPATGCVRTPVPNCPPMVDAGVDTAPDAPLPDAAPDTAVDAPLPDAAVDRAPDAPLARDAPRDTTPPRDTAPVDGPRDTAPAPRDAAADLATDRPPTDARPTDASRDAARDGMIAIRRVGGGGGCDCDISRRTPPNPLQATILLALALLWRTRRRPR